MRSGVLHFVNADLIAVGLSPLHPPLVARAPTRLVLAELDRLAGARLDLAFESTVSGFSYVNRMRKWKYVGYNSEIVLLPRSSLRPWRSNALPRVWCKAAIMCHVSTYCAASPEDR